MKNNKVVLAFSGGLDTSYCAIYLAEELGLEVHSAIVNTGGFDKKELKSIEDKAKALGVTSHKTLEQTEAYYQNVIKYLIYGNVLKNGNYPLSVSAERIYQAIALADYAKQIDASHIAHGSTGAGNDQVRFDLVFQLIAPDVEIITPIRDKQLSRQEEIEYLENHGFKQDWKKSQYSINKGLWGTSVGGSETLTSNMPLPEEAYPSQLKEKGSKTIRINFTKGEICGIDDKALNPVEAIEQLEKIASVYAIGRDIHVGDTIIGIKGRVGFEAAASTLIIKAHQLLEKHTLTKWQMHWKEQLASWYGMFIHEAQYFEPVMRNIEEFLTSTQQNVTGSVQLTLHPYRFTLDGIDSQHDLMNSGFGDYGEMNKAWTGEDVKGFIKIMANSMKIYNHKNPKS